MDAEERHDIVKMEVYMDKQGREVRSFVQVFGKSKAEPFYSGAKMVAVQMMGPGGQPMVREVPVEFPFPDGVSLKKAFETFDERLKEHIELMKKRQQEQAAANRIVPVAAMPKLNVLGPDGKPAAGK